MLRNAMNEKGIADKSIKVMRCDIAHTRLHSQFRHQPTELVWGVGKQRAGTLYKPGRSLKSTKKHLRRGWYGGKGKTTARLEA